MKIAVEGCMHGELDKVYTTHQRLEEVENTKIDLLICCGDFQVQDRTLGSKPAAELLDQLKPLYWFSAHLHCRFPAIIQHGEDGPVTKFLALDKCLKGRRFLQIIELESGPGPYEIQYDEGWLAITRKFNSIFPFTRRSVQLGGAQLDNQDYRQWARDRLNSRGAKPFDFVRTVPSFDPSQPFSSSLSGHCRNTQTESLLQFLELPYLCQKPTHQYRVPVS